MDTLREALEEVELIRRVLKNLEGKDSENWKERDVVNHQLQKIYLLSDWYSARYLAGQVMGIDADRSWENLREYVALASAELAVDSPYSLVGEYTATGVWQYPPNVLRRLAREDLNYMYKHLPTKLERELVGDALGYSMLVIKMKEHPITSIVSLVLLAIFFIYIFYNVVLQPSQL